MATAADEAVFTNDVFISYSRNDKVFARGLKKKLESFKPPKGLNAPQRTLVVFRDETDFTGVEYLAFERHLSSSKKMIVICSPDARKSEYVNDEIRHFAETRGTANIIPVLLSGIPNNEAKPGNEESMAFPEALCQVMEMPIAVSYLGFDPQKEKIDKGIFYGSWYAILANLFNTSRSEIEQRDKKRQARQRNVLISVASTVFSVISILAAYAWWQRDIAEQRRKEAERQRFLAISQALAAYAPREQENGRMDERAALLARQAFIFHQRNRGNRLDQIDRSLRQVLSIPYFSIRLGGLKDGPQFTSLALSRNNLWLAVGGNDAKVRLWKLNNLQTPPLLLSQNRGVIRSLAFGSKSEELFAGTEDGYVMSWKVNGEGSVTGARELPGPADKRILSVVVNADGDRLASGSADGRVRVWNLNEPQANPVVLSPRSDAKPVWAVSFHPKESNILASGGENAQVLIWDLRRPMMPIRALEGPETTARSLAFSPEGNEIACGTDREVVAPSIRDMMKMLTRGEEPGLSIVGGTILVWDLEKVDLRPKILGGHEATVTSLAFSPAGDILASASADTTIRLWRLGQSQGSSTILRGHDGGVASLGFTQNGRYLASAGGEDSSIRIWDMGKPTGAARVLRGHQEAVLSIAFSPDSKAIASVDGSEAAVRLWDVEHGRAQMVLRMTKSAPVSVVYHPRDETVAAGSKGNIIDPENFVQLWDLRTPKKTWRVLPHFFRSTVNLLAFSTSGKLLASAGEFDQDIVVWEMEHLEKPQAVLLAKPPANFRSLAFDPGDRKLAGSCGDNTLRIWDLDQPAKEPKVLRSSGGPIQAIAFSPDGRAFFSGDESGNLFMWNSEGAEWRPVMLGRCEGRIYALAVNRGGDSVASASSDGVVRVWSLASPSSDAIVLSGVGKSVYTVAFSPNDQWLAAGGSNKTVIVWPSTQALVEMVCKKVSRNLSKEEWDQFVGKDIPYEQTCPNLPAPDK